MATVSDELVERVAQAIEDGLWADLKFTMSDVEAEVAARAAIAALSMPEFVLPLAEEMLRDAGAHEVTLLRMVTHWAAIWDAAGTPFGEGDTLLDAYRAAKGEP